MVAENLQPARFALHSRGYFVNSSFGGAAGGVVTFDNARDNLHESNERNAFVNSNDTVAHLRSIAAMLRG
jgi:hypothetical protein